MNFVLQQKSETVPLLAAVPVPLKGGDDGEDRKYWKEQVEKLQEEITDLKRVCIYFVYIYILRLVALVNYLAFD